MALIEKNPDFMIKSNSGNDMNAERKIEIVKSDTLVLHNMSKFKGQKVEIIILPFDDETNSAVTSEELLKIAQTGGAFEFLNDPSEDIYTLEDGKPFDD